MTTHDCGSSTLRIVLLALLAVAAAPPDRYEFPSPGVVLDTRTMLVWQRVVDPSAHAFEDAPAYCGQLALAGMKWRLPTRAELSTLVDPTEKQPAIDELAFPETPSDQFWTSIRSSSGTPWVIDFRDGNSAGANQWATVPRYVRCVGQR